MGSQDKSREPCPDRILDDVGGAFGMGAVGGGTWHFIKGMYNSPKGERFLGGSQAVRMNAPRIGGSFAVWGGLFSVFDCSAVYLRQKEDPWNSIIAGAASSGLLQMRQGLGTACRSALAGGVLLALLEGFCIMSNRFTTPPPSMQMEAVPNMVVGADLPEPESSTSSSWLGGWFGGRKEEASTSTGVKTEVLESFDSPAPPTFEFK